MSFFIQYKHIIFLLLETQRNQYGSSADLDNYVYMHRDQKIMLPGGLKKYNSDTNMEQSLLIRLDFLSTSRLI